MANYEEVLHLIRYRNWHTASLFDRKFKLLCSELNGRYVSNEFRVEVGDCPWGWGSHHLLVQILNEYQEM